MPADSMIASQSLGGHAGQMASPAIISAAQAAQPSGGTAVHDSAADTIAAATAASQSGAPVHDMAADTLSASAAASQSGAPVHDMAADTLSASAAASQSGAPVHDSAADTLSGFGCGFAVGCSGARLGGGLAGRVQRTCGRSGPRLPWRCRQGGGGRRHGARGAGPPRRGRRGSACACRFVEGSSGHQPGKQRHRSAGHRRGAVRGRRRHRTRADRRSVRGGGGQPPDAEAELTRVTPAAAAWRGRRRASR